MLGSTDRDNENGRGTVVVAGVRDTYGPDRIVNLSVDEYITLYSVMTVTVDVLCEYMNKRFILMFVPRVIMAHATAVSSVFNLLNGIYLIELWIGLITSSTWFVDYVVFRIRATRL